MRLTRFLLAALLGLTGAASAWAQCQSNSWVWPLRKYNGFTDFTTLQEKGWTGSLTMGSPLIEGLWMAYVFTNGNSNLKVDPNSINYIGTYQYQGGSTALTLNKPSDVPASIPIPPANLISRMLLSTGAILNHPPGYDWGVNCPSWTITPATNGYLALAELLGYTNGAWVKDHNVLTFKFTVPNSNIDTIKTSVIFASEEWRKAANSRGNDVFGFWVDGVNYAKLPGTDLPISVLNIPESMLVDGKDFGYYRRTEEIPIEAKLDKTFSVHTITIAIGDGPYPNASTSNTAYDSAIFIGGPDSFTIGPPEEPTKPNPNNFNAFETNTEDDSTTGLIHTKLAGTPFSLKLVAVYKEANKDNVIADWFTDDVKVELLANKNPGENYDANHCPDAFDVLQTQFPATLSKGLAKNVSGFESAKAAKDVRVRITYTKDTSTVTACSTDSFAIRPASFKMDTSPSWSVSSPDAKPTYKAGTDPFTLTATTTKGYDGTPQISQAGIGMRSVEDKSLAALIGNFNQAKNDDDIGLSVAKGSFIFSEIPGFHLLKDAVYDSAFTAIDHDSGCLKGSTSNTLDSNGWYGCTIGSELSGLYGRFIPDHFDISLTQACESGAKSFTYSGQPFGKFTITAMNGLNPPKPTLNYAWGSIGMSKNVTLTEVSGASGELMRKSLDKKKFDKGSVSHIDFPDVGFKFDDKQTAPAIIQLRATDTDGVSSKGHDATATALIRSGRLQVFNAFGAATQTLAMVMQAQYWTGALWLINTDDSCTQLGAANFALSRNGEATALTSVTGVSAFNTGSATVTLASTNGNTATIKVAANLGDTAADSSCVSYKDDNIVASTGSKKDWLRARFGSCQAAQDWESDPHGSVTFGNRTRRAIHSRETFR